MSKKFPRLFRRFPFLVVIAIVGVPVTLLVASGVADRLGYCVMDVLPGSVGLNSGAYVQNIGSDHATIVWRTAAEREGSAELVAPDGTITRVDVGQNEIQEVPFENLEPATTYEWKVESGSEAFSGELTTAPEADGTVRLAAIGDSGTGSDAQYDVAAQIISAGPDLVLHTGDVVYRRGALCHYGPRYFSPYESLITKTPVFPVLGNHDVRADDGQAYFDTFALPVNDLDGTENYYSFDYGPVHIVALNTQVYGDDDQKAVELQRIWLEADLAATSMPWTVVVLHKPPFSSNGGKQSDKVQADLVPVFATAGVDLVLAGHAHNYERFEPIDGVTYIVTGGGGAELHNIDAGPQTAVAARRHHLVAIEVSPERMTISAIDREGEVFDTIELSSS